MPERNIFRPYIFSVIAVGAAVFLYSVTQISIEKIDVGLIVLVVLTLFITSRVSIPIPGVRAKISVSDTFVFLTLLLYGGEAAVIVAACEAFISTLFSTQKRWIWFFNASAIAIATFVTAWSLRLSLGDKFNPSAGFEPNFVIAVCLMAIVQYVVNSGLVAIAGGIREGQPLWQTWRKHYLWTSITYVAGASAAGIISRLMLALGPYAVVAASPIIIILYFTYRTYLQNVETSARQAAQAERHIEELSHYIAEQERIREQFTQLEKLSALGELASGVAHDFNNTLAGILGRAQLLLRTKDPDKIKRGLEIIIQSAEDGARTVKRIQDFARQRRDHGFEPISVAKLLSDVRDITRPRWKDRSEALGVQVSLELHCQTDANILGDGSELREVFVNMIFNAVDAMPSGGTITLTSVERNGFIEISVEDTGSGMNEEVRSRVFDPFFTTKGKAGMGLGLAVSYGIIRRHDGEITVESVQGKGTTFTIKLKAADISALPVNGDDSKAEKEQKANGIESAKILIVDDEETVRGLLGDILTCEGYEVALAASGHEALELLDKDRFDGIFTDIGMQGMTGWELAKAIRRMDLEIPLAVITGWGEAVGSEECEAAQVNWVVAKPFNTERILEIAEEVSKKRIETAERRARLRVLA